MNLLHILWITIVLIHAVTAMNDKSFVHNERFVFHGGKFDGCTMNCNYETLDFACSNGKIGNWQNGSFNFTVDYKGYELSSTKATLFGNFNCDQEQVHDIYVSLNGQPLDNQYFYKNICLCNTCHSRLFIHNIPRSIRMDPISNLFKVHTQSNNLCLSHIDAEFVFSPVKSSQVKVKRLFITGNSTELLPQCPDGILAGTKFNKYFHDGRINFMDPLSRGSLIVQAATKVYFKSQVNETNYGILTAFLNEFKIGDEMKYTNNVLSKCMGVKALEFRSPMLMGGIPKYNYGGKNTFTFTDSVASVIVGDVEIVLYYID